MSGNLSDSAKTLCFYTLLSDRLSEARRRWSDTPERLIRVTFSYGTHRNIEPVPCVTQGNSKWFTDSKDSKDKVRRNSLNPHGRLKKIYGGERGITSESGSEPSECPPGRASDGVKPFVFHTVLSDARRRWSGTHKSLVKGHFFPNGTHGIIWPGPYVPQENFEMIYEILRKS